ncbi:AAA family ATPase [Metabacillus sp. GX 13764]|uniref:AAA family ATPase n=1 Tax=Metabacillus kandeliae TaxID=2900151 RepID=UPI001E51B0CF|nr:AAA family ATPase [Metabacillus kandeliae]MCD7034118.1 AAA family ATPase [Metabacillus kandeliae]
MSLKQLRLRTEDIPNTRSYPFSIPSIGNLEELTFDKKVTFFVGENGSGKSTLLEGIAYQSGFHTAGGGRNNTYEVDASGSDLGQYLRLSWSPNIMDGFFLRSESFYQFASYVDEVASEDPRAYSSYGGKSLHQQSHGESFFSLFLNRFGGKALYLLDEPEAALSPARQLAFLKVIHDLAEGEDAQFIIATHSPILMGYPGAAIYSFDEGRVEEVSYEQTDHYLLTKYFLENRERYLMELFQDGNE